MVSFIIQARLGSTRFPMKILHPFYNNKGVLEILIEKILNNFPQNKIVVATTDNSIDQKIVRLCKEMNIDYYQGSENNVLKRFIDAAEFFEINKIIRICSDNPFLNIKALEALIEYSNYSDLDYISFQTKDGKPTILTHYGLWAEFVSLDALKTVQRLTNDCFYLEHVTNYIYSNPYLFKIDFIPISEKIDGYNNLRLTLDTKEDFDLLKEIYSQYHNFSSRPEELIELISSNKYWIEVMRNQIKLNSK